jgi:hypothetical protein
MRVAVGKAVPGTEQELNALVRMRDEGLYTWLQPAHVMLGLLDFPSCTWQHLLQERSSGFSLAALNRRNFVNVDIVTHWRIKSSDTELPQ